MRQSARGLLQVRLSGVSAEAVQRRPQPLRLRRARGMVLARLRDGLRLRLFDERRVAEATGQRIRSEEHTSELQSLMRISYAVFCLKKKKNNTYTVKRIVQRTTKTTT